MSKLRTGPLKITYLYQLLTQKPIDLEVLSRSWDTATTRLITLSIYMLSWLYFHSSSVIPYLASLGVLGFNQTKIFFPMWSWSVCDTTSSIIVVNYWIIKENPRQNPSVVLSFFLLLMEGKVVGLEIYYRSSLFQFLNSTFTLAFLCFEFSDENSKSSKQVDGIWLNLIVVFFRYKMIDKDCKVLKIFYLY